jgi:hypothetical protein
MPTCRTDFNETWLYEMPMGLGSFPMFNVIDYTIKDRIKSGAEVINLENGLRKIVGKQTAYYWYEKNGIIILGVELSIKPQGLVVTGLAKNPKFKGPPFASDLYDAILKDSNRSIRLVI